MAGNANSGRRPQPTALKVIRGNPGKRKLNTSEPKPPSGAVVKPAYLSKMAGVVWDEEAPIAIAMGTLTPADRSAFAKLCELEATSRHASQQKDAPEWAMFTLSEDYNSALKVGTHAAVKVERETATALRPYYEKFGMEPSGRGRIAVQKSQEPASKWAGIL